MGMAWLLVVAALLALLFCESHSCPSSCVCRWKSGKETVECLGKRLTGLPAGIDGGTQVLDLSENSLQALPRDMFVASGLLNLQRIYMANCKIGRIDDNAFSRLSNLVELDLSGNLIIAVPTETFKDFPALRRLVLSNNPITRIESNAFIQLTALNVLEMSHCRVDTILPRGFDGLEGLTQLKIDNNRLSTIPGRALAQLKGLHGITLHVNPWKCDCHLRDFKQWFLTSEVSYGPVPVCKSPPRMQGKLVEHIPIEELACEPTGSLYKPHNRHVDAYSGDNVSLFCKVHGVPEPHIRWLWKGRPIANMSSLAYMSNLAYGFSSIPVIRENGTTDKISILTVSSVGEQDSGEYVCLAENKAGKLYTNFSLNVEARPVDPVGLTTMQIAGIGVGLVVLGFVVLVLICVLFVRWKRTVSDGRKHVTVNKIPSKQANSIAHMGLEIDREQYEMKAGNPVKKPSSSGPNSGYNSTDLSPYDRKFLENSIGGSGAVRPLTNKPDVVNVDDRGTVGEDMSRDKERGPRKLKDKMPDVDLSNKREDKMPDLQESLNYSPESPKQTWGKEFDKDLVYDYDDLEPKVHYDIVDSESEWKAHNYDSPNFGSGNSWMADTNPDVNEEAWYPEAINKSFNTYNSSLPLQQRPSSPFDWREESTSHIHLPVAKSGGGGGSEADTLHPSHSAYSLAANSNPFGMPKSNNPRFRNLVPVLPPFPPHQAVRATHSPDEGYEDEGEEGTEV